MQLQSPFELGRRMRTVHGGRGDGGGDAVRLRVEELGLRRHSAEDVHNVRAHAKVHSDVDFVLRHFKQRTDFTGMTGMTGTESRISATTGSMRTLFHGHTFCVGGHSAQMDALAMENDSEHTATMETASRTPLPLPMRHRHAHAHEDRQRYATAANTPMPSVVDRNISNATTLRDFKVETPTPPHRLSPTPRMPMSLERSPQLAMSVMNGILLQSPAMEPIEAIGPTMDRMQSPTLTYSNRSQRRQQQQQQHEDEDENKESESHFV